jgi:hypothetical protein
MLLALVISSTISVAADELTLPPWPSKLRAERRDGGVWLDDATSKAMHYRLELCDRLPELARQVGTVRVESALAVQDELHQVDMAQQAARVDKLEGNQRTTLKTLRDIGIGAGVVAIVLGALKVIGK